MRGNQGKSAGDMFKTREAALANASEGRRKWWKDDAEDGSRSPQVQGSEAELRRAIQSYRKGPSRGVTCFVLHLLFQHQSHFCAWSGSERCRRENQTPARRLGSIPDER